MKKILKPVIFDGTAYFGIKDFDVRIVSLFTEETLMGTMFTVLPISSLEYRKESPTKARVEISTPDKHWTRFDIYCDWGEKYTVDIHNSLSEEIERAKNSAELQELLTPSLHQGIKH